MGECRIRHRHPIQKATVQGRMHIKIKKDKEKKKKVTWFRLSETTSSIYDISQVSARFVFALTHSHPLRCQQSNMSTHTET